VIETSHAGRSRLGPLERPRQPDHQQPDYEIERLKLDRIGRLLADEQFQRSLRLFDANGQAFPLPVSLARVLREAACFLARDHAIMLLPMERELTTQQAADILDVSRPHLIELLESGALPLHKTGLRRRVSLVALLAYKRRRDEARERALDELGQLNEDMRVCEAS
jgi:excisionase family DNA binding protein